MKEAFMKRTTVLAVLILLALPNSAWAQAPTPGATNFPLIGITRGLSLRLNLVAINVPASPGSVALPPNPCMATLGFQDRNGNTLGTTETVTLAVGQTASLALNADDVIVGVTTKPTTTSADVANAAGVAAVLPMVTPLGGTGASCVATVEVVDNLLRTPTQNFTGSVALPANPIFGPQSVYPLLNVQLDVVASPPNACIAQLSFADQYGNPIGPTESVDTFHSASLVLPWSVVWPTYTFSSPFPTEPILITPIVTQTSPLSACIASGEVINVFFERVCHYFYPLTPLQFPLDPLIYIVP